MRPLTIDRPKVMCPVADRALIDHALDRLRSFTGDVAVNAHESQASLIAHLDGVAHVSVEADEALGTAGALAPLRDWIDGRASLVVNGDTWCPGGLDSLIEGWDGTSIRVLVAGAPVFGPRIRVAGALMPWSDVEPLDAVPSGLYEVMWRAADAAGRLEAVGYSGPFVDCATPADYLRANLEAAGTSVIGHGAVVHGTVVDSVVWPDAVVHAGEHLERAIRTDTGRTVLIRS